MALERANHSVPATSVAMKAGMFFDLLRQGHIGGISLSPRCPIIKKIRNRRIGA